MKTIALLKTHKIIGVVLSLILPVVANADSIRISTPGGILDCDYSSLTLSDGSSPIINLSSDANGETCVVTKDSTPPPQSNLPTPIAPLGTVVGSKPAFYSWYAVDGANKYLMLISKNGTPVKYIHVGGALSSSGDAGEISTICNNDDGNGQYCKYEAPVNYAGTQDLTNGDYTWTIRVKESGGLNTTFDQVGTRTFTINVQENLEAAVESAAHFEVDWQNLYYNPNTGENNYSTKAQLRDLIGLGYQQVTTAGLSKEVYILNPSRNITTIIPSCANGQEYSFSGANCQIDEPFKRNEIYALRGRTTDNINYTGATVSKDSGQLYAGNGESYKVVISPFPGEMDAVRSGSFSGDCEATAFGSLYLGMKGTGVDPNNTWDECEVPPNTDFYVNVELLDESSRGICDAALCQMDLKLTGVQAPSGL